MDELKAAQVRLLQAGKLVAMGEMAAGVAHELSHPLLGISGYATAMLEDLERRDAGAEARAWRCQAQKDLAVILQQTRRMTQILNQVRDFARGSVTEFTLLDVSEPLEVALSLFNEQLKAHGIALERRATAGLPPVRANSNRLQQVFINLISNAIDAMDAKVERRGKLSVGLGLDAVANRVQVTLTDSGIGADEETIAHMFDPFFTTKGGGQGTGLGLAIARNIIEELGGDISASCEPANGCCFTICLPVAAE